MKTLKYDIVINNLLLFKKEMRHGIVFEYLNM